MLRSALSASLRPFCLVAPRCGRHAVGLVVAGLVACGGEDASPDSGDTVDAGDLAADTEVEADVAHFPGLDIDYGEGGVSLRYDPTGAGFTATPWPTDRLRDASGHIDLSSFPGADDGGIIERYATYGEEALDGWGRNSAIYFQITPAGTALVDAASLPSAQVSMADPKASVQLVDVSSGPRRGQRSPLVFSVIDRTGDPFIAAPTLAMRPVYGFPLADATPYCAIVTRAVRGTDGKYLAPSAGFLTALDSEPSLAPLRAWLPESALDRRDLAAATCFTTQDATIDMRRLEAFMKERPTPTPTTLEYTGKTANFHEIIGHYESPNFQSGDKPYRNEGGDLRYDGDGKPIVAAVENLRFRLLIPRQFSMPAAGWPVILYSHGTFGDWATCIEGAEAEAVREGLAMICIDQPLHGDRRADLTADVDFLDVFNFLNPRSGRMTFRQSAVDTMWLSRMIVDGRFDLAAAATTFGEAIKLDPANIVFFGHSHGGLAGTIVLAADARIKGAVLSGASGVMTETILLRKDPLDISATLALILGVEEPWLDTFHPAMTLAQTLVDATDPINYAPYWLEPVTGGNSKHVFMTEGTMDEASPAVGADAVAAAAGIPLLNPVAQPSLAHELKGLRPVDMPVNSNLASTNGQLITGALRQFLGGDHFVALTDRSAIQIWRGFFRAFRQGDVPTIQP